MQAHTDEARRQQHPPNVDIVPLTASWRLFAAFGPVDGDTTQRVASNQSAYSLMNQLTLMSRSFF
jgi:hypothetical protein